MASSDGSSRFSVSDETAESYVDGTRIRFGKILTTIVGALSFGVSAVYFRAIDRIVALGVWAIDGLGETTAQFVRTVLGDSAAVQVSAWRVALREAVQYGPLAPVILVSIALLAVWIAAEIWDRRPYS